MRPILEIKDLAIQFNTDDGCVRAVNHIDLVVEEGDTLGLVGETGAGKTTTALGILRLIDEPPGEFSSGEILFDGEDVLKMNKDKLRKLRGKDISMIFQDPMTALNPVLRVEDQIAENIQLHESISKQDALRKALDMLKMVGIRPERGSDYPHQFSGGMKQRVVIAMALACNPRLLIADEPTTALDVTIQAQVLEKMRELRDDLGTSMILITHDLGVVAETCNKVAIMYAGEIIEYGDLQQVYLETAHPYTVGLFGALPSMAGGAKRLKPIAGLMPDPMDLPTGCSFHPRCPMATERCRKEDPTVTELSPGHLCKCHFAADKAKKAEATPATEDKI